MKDLLPLSEELKEKLIEVLRETVQELSGHKDLYSTAFRLYFTELGKILNNTEGLDSQELVDEASLLMGVISEYVLNEGDVYYELVDLGTDDVELEE